MVLSEEEKVQGHIHSGVLGSNKTTQIASPYWFTAIIESVLPVAKNLLFHHSSVRLFRPARIILLMKRIMTPRQYGLLKLFCGLVMGAMIFLINALAAYLITICFIWTDYEKIIFNVSYSIGMAYVIYSLVGMILHKEWLMERKGDKSFFVIESLHDSLKNVMAFYLVLSVVVLLWINTR